MRSLDRHHHFGPIFIPYAVPYTQFVAVPEGYVGDEEDPDYASGGSMLDRRPARQLRPERPWMESGSAAGLKSAEPSQSTGETVAAQPSTVLIFKDGHQLDIENYAIVGETLFDFANGFTHKIQLADLDLPATQKANDDRGVEFHAPSLGAQ